MTEADLSKIDGLTSKQAQELLKEEGFNELPIQKKRSIFILLFDILKEPMFALLIGAGLIYFFLGEIKDTLMLGSFIFVVVGITIYQQRKTEKALEALKNLSSPRALVIRDGHEVRIAGREVVRGDVIILREGDRVPADAQVLECTNFSVDESLLTGESLQVRKTQWDGKSKMVRPGGEDLPFVYSGTMVVQGRAIVKSIAIGIHTEMGKIGRALETVKEEDTLLQKETGKIVRTFAIAGILLSLLMVLILGLVRGLWLQGLLSGLTLSMSMLPEEFPVVLLIFLTLGAWRMSKKNVLTRKNSAIETLGAASILCVDKTGTLTLNKMQLTSLYAKKANFEITEGVKLPENFHNLLEYAMLASQLDPFDPIEKAVKSVSQKFLINTEHIHQNWNLVKEYPLSKQLLALSHVWSSPDLKQSVIAAKGAPEAIMDLCHMDTDGKKEIMDQISQMARRGLRVLGVARSVFTKSNLPKKQHDFIFEFIGLVGFRDPVRPTVSKAVDEAYKAGVRVIMITGDYPGTASYVAKMIGLRNPQKFITGTELTTLDHLQLREKIKSVNIFARVIPEQKLAIVNALKANGEIVAMTGDGVNDAPALKSAHIGIAMGERGTDVAREASSLVLLNDDFSLIVLAVRLGRKIYDNLKKAMSYIFAVHMPIAGMSLLPVLFNLPIILFPAHIAFLELIIDPACSTVFEAVSEEKNIMNRPPRNLRDSLFNKRTLTLSLMQGITVLIAVFLILLTFMRFGRSETEIRTITFVTLVFANLLLIITNISWTDNFINILQKKNQSLLYVLLGTVMVLGLVVYLPFLQKLFHFSTLRFTDLLVALFMSVVSISWFEIFKIINKKSKAMI